MVTCINIVKKSKRLRDERRQERNAATRTGTTNKRKRINDTRVQDVCRAKPKSVKRQENRESDDEDSDSSGSEEEFMQQSQREIHTDNHGMIRRVDYQNTIQYEDRDGEDELQGYSGRKISKHHNYSVSQNDNTRNEYTGKSANSHGCEDESDWKKKYMELKDEMDYRINASRCEIYSDGRHINRSTKMQLEILVKTVMFPRQKFITQHELQDLTNKCSFGNKLMDKMFIPISERVETWSNYAMVANKHLVKVRSSKTTAMKVEFFKRGECVKIFNNYFKTMTHSTS